MRNMKQLCYTDEYGIQYWRNEQGDLNRLDGPALVYADGSAEWFLNGKRHRENGPAYESSNGYKAWYVNGKRHRLDGAAVEGLSVKEWWVNGEQYSKNDFPIIVIKFLLNCDEKIAETILELLNEI
jgi:hypothetical protein